MCLFVFKNISQVFVRFGLFPFYLTGEATKWLGKLQNDSVTCWEELNEAFIERFSPPTLKYG